jgi:hypothetical protein
MSTASVAVGPGGVAAGRLRYPWVFSPRADVSMLLAPALVTLIAFGVAMRAGQDDGGSARGVAMWVTAFLLGNTTHVILTYLLLTVRRDMLHATEKQAATVLGASLAVFALSLFLTRSTENDPIFRPLLEAATFVLATHHTLSQAKGFWALYGIRGSREGLPPPSERERSLQRLFVPIGILLVSMRWTLVGKRPFSESPPMMNVNPGDPAILPFWVSWALLAAWIVFAIALFRALLAYDRVSVPKLVYLGVWCGIVALDLCAPGWGAVMSAGMHGLEYTWLTHRMLSPTPAERDARLRGALVWVAMIASMAPILLVGAMRNPLGLRVPVGAAAGSWLLAIVNAVVLAHYAADAFIFRFRLPGVRKVAMARLGFAP